MNYIKSMKSKLKSIQTRIKQIQALLNNNPKLSNAGIGRRLRLSRSYIALLDKRYRIRKDLDKLEKLVDFVAIPGLLLIKCINNGKCYVACGKDTLNAKNYHYYRLRKNSHPCTQLQDDYNKYGHDSFSFEMVSLTDTWYIPPSARKNPYEAKDTYIKSYFYHSPEKCYNVLDVVVTPTGRKSIKIRRFGPMNKTGRSWASWSRELEMKEFDSEQRYSPSYISDVYYSKKKDPLVSLYLSGLM